MTEQIPDNQEAPKAQSCAKPSRLRRWLLEALALLLILTLVHFWQTRDTAQGQAPPLTANLVSGEAFTLASPREKPLLVYFWSTWCPICRMTTGSVDSLAEESPVITIALQSGDARTVADYLENKALKFPVINDPDGRIAKAWGARGVPTFYILDKQGKIRFVSVGYTSSLGLRIRLWLTEWLPV